MSFPDRDLQSKLDEMEAELKQEPNNDSNISQPVFPKVEINSSPQVQGLIDRSKSLFQSLPKFGKVAVAVGGVWLGFSVLGAVLHVVSSIVSVGVIGLLLYVGYRLFTNSSESS